MSTARPMIPGQTQLEWLVQGNPKHIGSSAWERFEKSIGAPTVVEYKARGGSVENLHADIDRGFVRVRI